MASITSNILDGYHDVPASWVGGIVPGNGDNAIIANGAIIRVRTGTIWTIGDNINVAFNTSTNSNGVAIGVASATSAGTGRLIVEVGAKLILKGHVKQNNANWVIEAGAIINSGGTSTTLYGWGISLAASMPNALLTINGTLSSHVTFGKEVGCDNLGPIGNVLSAFVDGGRIQATYCDFNNIGGAATNCYTGYGGSAVFDILFDHCTWTNCGIIAISNILNDSLKIQFLYCKIINPIATNGRCIFIASSTWTSTGIGIGGIRLIKNCVIYGQVCFQSSAFNKSDFTIENNIFRNNGDTISQFSFLNNVSVASFKNNILYSNATGVKDSGPGPGGTHLNCLYLRKSNAAPGSPSDVDMFRFSATPKFDVTIDGCIIEFQSCGADATHLDLSGDFFIISGQDTTILTTNIIQNCIYLPSEFGAAHGTIFVPSVTGAQTNLDRLRVIIQHNTMCVSGSGSGVVTIFEDVTTSNITSPTAVYKIRSNLFWKGVSTAAKFATIGGSHTINDGIMDSCDFNGKWNVNGNPYDDLAISKYQNPSPPGANDITGDPTFVDSTRNFQNWLISIDPALTNWNLGVAAMELTILEIVGYNPNLICSNAINWIRAGYAPTNPVFKNTAHDGTDIGAVPVILGSGGGEVQTGPKRSSIGIGIGIGI